MTDHAVQIEFFPDGSGPIPMLMTEAEAIKVLRIDVDKTPDAAHKAFLRLLEKRLLVPTKGIRKENLYARSAVLRCIERLTPLDS